MRKIKNFKLLISLTVFFFIATIFFTIPFLLNFNDKKEALEKILKNNLKYNAEIKGDIKYSLYPFISIKATNVHIEDKEEKSILENIYFQTNIFDIYNKTLKSSSLLLEKGQFLINKNFFNESEQDFLKVSFTNLDLRFVNKNKNFLINDTNGYLKLKKNKITQAKIQSKLGEVPFEIKYKNEELNVEFEKINLKFKFKDFLSEKKFFTLSYNSFPLFLGLNKIFTEGEFLEKEKNIKFISKKFDSNLFDGNLEIDIITDPLLSINLNGIFNDARFDKVLSKDFINFLKNDFSKISSFMDLNLSLKFSNIRFFKKLFSSANLNLKFQNGDTNIDQASFLSDENQLFISGRNVNYEKDNLYFYNFNFKTINLKKICYDFCNNKSFIEQISQQNYEIKSRGIFNLNKAKITVEEHQTLDDYKDDRLNQITNNLNNKVFKGDLNNLFDISKYFLIY